MNNFICHDCKKDCSNEPMYVSQESKDYEIVFFDEKPAIQAGPWNVCKECYLAGFRRVYPNAPLPELP